MTMKKKRNVYSEIFFAAFNHFLVKERSIYQPYSFSPLYKEVFGSEDIDEGGPSGVSKYCNIGEGSSTSNESLECRKVNKVEASKKHNHNGVSKKSLKRKAKKRRTKKATSSKKPKSQNNKNINVEEEQEHPQELPVVVKERIEEMEGDDAKLVIQKELTKSDLNSNNGRFSIPKRKIREEAKDFLTQEEKSSLDVREGKNKRLAGISVSVLDPNLRIYDNMCFKKWEMETTEVYNITRGWNDLVRDNHLKANDKVQLWSFRTHHHDHDDDHHLCFALVKL